jgi:hypothetical protein
MSGTPAWPKARRSTNGPRGRYIGTSEGSVVFVPQLVEWYPVELAEPPGPLNDMVD